jgi:hypothetical protein
MSIRTALVALLVVGAVPLTTNAGKKKELERGMLEKMEAVPCGAKERGFTGLGSIWASAGITHVNSNEQLCPLYLLRTDEMDYEIRPTDGKHPVVLPVGHEGEFKIKKDVMLLKFEDGDGKTRTYKVVAENPTNSNGSSQSASGKAPEKP